MNKELSKAAYDASKEILIYVIGHRISDVRGFMPMMECEEAIEKIIKKHLASIA